MLLEERRYPPPPEFAAQANAQPEIYERDFEEFWETRGPRARHLVRAVHDALRVGAAVREVVPRRQAQRLLTTASTATSRPGAATRSPTTGRASPRTSGGRSPSPTSSREVVRFANALKELGVGKGTPVGIYMGMVPELPVAMLACARLGAPHTVVFGGFSADSLSDRLQRHGVRGADHAGRGWRKGGDGAAEARTPTRRSPRSPGVKTSVVLRRTGGEVPMQRGPRPLVARARRGQSDDPATCPCEPMDSEDLLYLLYTTGTTAKPKGIVAHDRPATSSASPTTHHYIFDVKPDSVYWCAADIGWVTGHSYIVYGPLCNGDHRRPLRGRARLPGQGPLVGDRRALQGRHPLHGADRDPRAHEVGPGARARSTTSRRCGCSARSASRSTRRRGSGTASTSAAAAARSSTPGGRPRPG